MADEPMAGEAMAEAAGAEEAMMDLSGRQLGEFVLFEKIGEGGHAVVYRCEQPLLKRDAVIKVLRTRRRHEGDALDRFMREAQLASRLEHPYAAHVYAFGAEAEDDLLWIAMELVHGITLSKWLAAHGRMPLEQFAPFFEAVAEVVQAAHEQGIVHRDLKPSNMMVIERGGRLFPKLLDFGIAKAINNVARPAPDPAGPSGLRNASAAAVAGPQEPRTRTDPREHPLTFSRAAMGSAPYMSPEQWLDARTAGPGSDIYALGIITYEALAGRRPFVAATTDEYYQQHIWADVPPLGGDFAPDLDRIVRRALSKDPRDRHGNVLALASELRAALRAQPREQLKSLAQVWDDRERSPTLLLQDGDLMRAPIGVLGDVERAFVAASRRHDARAVWIRRTLAVTAGALVVAAVWYQGKLATELAEQQARAAQQVAEATITQAELEQGRSALLHGEPDAQLHLAEAYKRGDHSPSTAFMLARALQPRLTEQARFTSIRGRTWSAVFSPDDRQIVTTDDGGVQVWNAQTYQLRFRMPQADEVYDAVYSADSTRLVTVSQTAVSIWASASGALVHELKRTRSDGKPADYYKGAMSADGRLVAAIDSLGSVTQVWNAITGTPVAELRGDGAEFPGLAFSSDGHWLATTGGNDVHVFDTGTWRPALTIRGPRIHRFAFDPAGTRLVTGADTGDVAIWSIPRGARIQHLHESGEPIDAVAFSPDGQLVVAGHRDGTVQIWHAASGKPRNQFNPRRSKIFAVEIDRTSKLVLATHEDGTVIVADVALTMPITVLEGPQHAVRVAHFDASARRVVGASRDGAVRVWNTTAPYLRWSSPPTSEDCGIVMSPESDRRFIAVGCKDHPTHVWDTSRDQLLADLPSVTQVAGDFTSAFPAVSAEGDRAAIARGDAVEIYELPGGRLLRTIAQSAPVNAVAFAGKGRDVISGAVDGSVLVTRDNGTSIALPRSPGGIDTVAFLPDGRLVTSDAQRRLRIYDSGGIALADLEIPARAISLRSSGGRLVTVPIYTGNVAPPVLVDLERYRLVAQLEGHVGLVFSARWAAGARILTTGAVGLTRFRGHLPSLFRHDERGIHESDEVVQAAQTPQVHA